MSSLAPLRCQSLVNELIMEGMTAVYVNNQKTYSHAFNSLKITEVLIWIHKNGEDVVLLGDNEIDVVRFKFHKTGPIRSSEVRGV